MTENEQTLKEMAAYDLSVYDLVDMDEIAMLAGMDFSVLEVKDSSTLTSDGEPVSVGDFICRPDFSTYLGIADKLASAFGLACHELRYDAPDYIEFNVCVFAKLKEVLRYDLANLQDQRKDRHARNQRG